MDQVAQLLNSMLSQIGTLIRYVAPGYVALIVFSLGAGLTRANLTDKDQSLFLLAGGLAGVWLYGLHTAVFFPIEEEIVFRILRCRCRCVTWMWTWFVKPEEFTESHSYLLFRRIGKQRWFRRHCLPVNSLSGAKAFQSELEKWAALLNFMYCCSYPFLFLSIWKFLRGWLALGHLPWQRAVWEPPFWESPWKLFITFWLLFMPCVASSVRMVNVEIWTSEKHQVTPPNE